MTTTIAHEPRINTEEQALLRAVLVNPADDLPRFLYADWLEERGQAERAEFIRRHIGGELKGWKRFDRSLRKACAGAEKMLREPIRSRGGWITNGSLIASGRGARFNVRNGFVLNYYHHPNGETDYTRPYPRTRLYFSRGMIDSVDCSLKEWLDHGATVVAYHPVARVVIEGRNIIQNGADGTFGFAYYGAFPSRYWAELQGHPTFIAAEIALNKVCLSSALTSAGLQVNQ